MRALVYEGDKTLSIKNKRIPKIGKGECLIRVAYAGICGSDLLLWNGGYPRVKPPLTIGHEFSGIIEQVGDPSSSLVKGDRVVVEPLITCNQCDSCKKGNYNICDKLNLIGIDKDGGMAKYVVASEHQIYKIPSNVSMIDAAFTEPLAVGVHMVRMSKLQKGQTALFIGGGPVGLIAASIAKIKGAKVYVSEVNPYRLEKAKELGFEVINPQETNIVSFIQSVTDGIGADVTFEVTGSNFGLTDCMETVKPKGVVLIAGMASKKHEIDTYKIIQKEIEITGSRVYTGQDFTEALQLMEEKLFLPEEFITRFVTLDNVVKDGFESIEKGDPVLKILVNLEAED